MIPRKIADDKYIFIFFIIFISIIIVIIIIIIIIIITFFGRVGGLGEGSAVIHF